jgi:hypothetical protein
VKTTPRPVALKPSSVPPEVAELAHPLPLVARLVVEVRSDGSRTVVRGLIEDLASCERTVIEAGAESGRALLTVFVRAASRMTRLAAGRTSRQVALSAATVPLLSMTSWTKRVLSRASSGSTKG